MELEQAINGRAMARVAELRAAFRGAEPFPHVVVDDFLTPQFAQRLLDQFPSFDRGNNVGDDGKAGNKSTFERVRSLGHDYAQLDDLVKSREFLGLIEGITGIPGL